MSNAAIERFNERWTRLCGIKDTLNELAKDHLAEGMRLTFTMDDDDIPSFTKQLERDFAKYNKAENEAVEAYEAINKNLDKASSADLSKFATRVKNSALATMQLLIKYKLVDHEEITYIASRKTIAIDGEDVWYFG